MMNNDSFSIAISGKKYSVMEDLLSYFPVFKYHPYHIVPADVALDNGSYIFQKDIL